MFDNEGLLVGNTPYRDEGTVITVWGNDNTTDSKDGLYPHEKLNFKLLRQNSLFLENIDITSWKKGSGFYSVNGISIAGSMTQNIIKEKKLVNVTDELGRKVNSDTKRPILYIYDDGSVEKKYIVK